MALSDKHIDHVCLFAQGHHQCRYLQEDFNDSGDIVCYCAKLTAERKLIDEKAWQAMHDQSPNAPLGDNCKGYLKLLNKKQGYDIKD